MCLSGQGLWHQQHPECSARLVFGGERKEAIEAKPIASGTKLSLLCLWTLLASNFAKELAPPRKEVVFRAGNHPFLAELLQMVRNSQC